MRKLYLYDTRKIFRFTRVYEKKALRYGEFISYDETVVNSDNLFMIDDRFEQGIPNFIIVEEHVSYFTEFYSGKEIIDFNQIDYVNGIVIDPIDFLENIFPIKETDVALLIEKYNTEMLKRNFNKFIKIARKEYIFELQRRDFEQLKEVSRIGRAMEKRLIKENG